MSELTPMFDPQRFEQQLAATDTVRRAVLGAIVLGWAGSYLLPLAMTIWPTVLLLGGIVLWLAASHVSNRTTRLAVEAARHAATPDGAEALDRALAEGLRRFTMYRSIRVMLYHQLAVLRARQRRDAEASAICAALLHDELVPPTTGQRAKLLLLFAEVALRRGELWGAWAALGELSERSLPLGDRLKRLELLTRYEEGCGRAGAMLAQLPSKVALAELMGPGQAAAMHRLLGSAAERSGYARTAEWLNTRAELLGGPGGSWDEEPESAPWLDGLAGEI